MADFYGCEDSAWIKGLIVSDQFRWTITLVIYFELWIWISHRIWIRSFGPEILTPIENLDVSASCHTFWFVAPPICSDAARTPTRQLQQRIGDRLRPPIKVAPRSEHQRTPPDPLAPQPVQPRPGGVTARAPLLARTSPPPMCVAVRRRTDGARFQPARLPLSLHLQHGMLWHCMCRP